RSLRNSMSSRWSVLQVVCSIFCRFLLLVADSAPTMHKIYPAARASRRARKILRPTLFLSLPIQIKGACLSHVSMSPSEISKNKTHPTRFCSLELPGFLIPPAGIFMYHYMVFSIHHPLLRMR